MIAHILASIFLIGGAALVYLGFELALEKRGAAKGGYCSDDFEDFEHFERQSAADYVFAGVFMVCLGAAACACGSLIFWLWA